MVPAECARPFERLLDNAGKRYQKSVRPLKTGSLREEPPIRGIRGPAFHEYQQHRNAAQDFGKYKPPSLASPAKQNVVELKCWRLAACTDVLHSFLAPQ